MTTDITPESLPPQQWREDVLGVIRAVAHIAKSYDERGRSSMPITLDEAVTLLYAANQYLAADSIAANDAEFARKAAERAWDECSIAWANRQVVAETIISRAAECVREAYPRDQVAAVLSNTLPQRPVNPYRAEQIGEEH